MSTKRLKVSDYLGKTFSCDCGKEHFVPVKYILIENEALLTLPGLIQDNGFSNPFFLYDVTTFRVAGDKIITLMEKSNLPYKSYTLKEEEPVPDEKALGEILIHIEESCDFLIGCGSGTINDLCRFISYKLHIPYMIVATAPSMDGFASNVAPLIVKHMKTTFEAQIPYAILGDTSLLIEAPTKMIAAGIGDILGKYTCLCDWKLAHIITGEYHCQVIEGIIKQSLDTVVSNILAAKAKSAEAIQSIMEALVLSGIAMSFAGNSRPASGSEHHLSHYWEMIFLFQGKQPVLHGAKVGIGTIAVLKAYELLKTMDIDFKKAETEAGRFSKIVWEDLMKRTYYDAAEAVIALENQVCKNAPENVVPRIRLLEKNWADIRKIVEQLPSADEVSAYLSNLDAPRTPMSVGIDKETFINSFIVAKELRNRFGLLQILFDLGLTEVIAEKVWDYFQE